jgi:hypothetical protein
MTQKKRGRPRKRRARTEHPGVKLKRLARATGDSWVARWIDPDTGAWKQQSLTLLKLTTDEARRDWAVKQAGKLKAKRLAVTLDEDEAAEISLSSAVTEYLNDLDRKRPKTQALYALALGHFTGWASKAGVRHVHELTGAHMIALKTYLHKLRAKRSVKGRGTGRGTQESTNSLLAPNTVNQFIRGIRTFLREQRERDRTPMLNGDMIRERLKFLPVDRDGAEYLRPRQLRQLLEACERHDTATYARHRWKVGHHYPAITPFVVTVLLGGFRYGEAADLRWEQIDLEAGEVHLQGAGTKTHRGRTVRLRETPTLWAMLERLKLSAGDSPYVFGPMRRDIAESCRRRLCGMFGAPAFTWQVLRSTCGTFLTCAPSIYGSAAVFLSAKRLGHSVAVAEKHYLGVIDNIPKEADTLEAAMQIDDLLATPTTASLPKAANC